jgi:hypothetical protein
LRHDNFTNVRPWRFLSLRQYRNVGDTILCAESGAYSGLVGTPSAWAGQVSFGVRVPHSYPDSTGSDASWRLLIISCADMRQNGLSHVFGRGQTRACSFSALAARARARPEGEQHASATQFKFIFTLKKTTELPRSNERRSLIGQSRNIQKFRNFKLRSNRFVSLICVHKTLSHSCTSVYIFCQEGDYPLRLWLYDITRQTQRWDSRKGSTRRVSIRR